MVMGTYKGGSAPYETRHQHILLAHAPGQDAKRHMGGPQTWRPPGGGQTTPISNLGPRKLAGLLRRVFPELMRAACSGPEEGQRVLPAQPPPQGPAQTQPTGGG